MGAGITGYFQKVGKAAEKKKVFSLYVFSSLGDRYALVNVNKQLWR